VDVVTILFISPGTVTVRPAISTTVRLVTVGVTVEVATSVTVSVTVEVLFWVADEIIVVGTSTCVSNETVLGSRNGPGNGKLFLLLQPESNPLPIALPTITVRHQKENSSWIFLQIVAFHRLEFVYFVFCPLFRLLL
jgi:hypothetical protein